MCEMSRQGYYNKGWHFTFVSTPTTAVIHDMGVVDLDLEVAMERILLASKLLKMDDSRISKRLLTSMLEKKVPGFCTYLMEALNGS